MREYPLGLETSNVPEAIAAIPFFRDLPVDLTEEILMNTTIMDCEPREVIIQEGAKDEAILFLLKGQVLVEKEGTIIGATHEKGTMLGELSLLRKGQRTATLVAATHVYCLKMKSDFLERLSPKETNAYWAALYRFVAELLAQRLEAMTLKLARAEQMLNEIRKGQ